MLQHNFAEEQVLTNMQNLLMTIMNNLSPHDTNKSIINNQLCYKNNFNSSPFFNGVFATANSMNELKTIMPNIIEYFSKEKKSFAFWLTHSENISEQSQNDLKYFGFIPQTPNLGLFSELNNIKYFQVSDNIKIKRVSTNEEYQQFINIYSEVSEFNQSLKTDIFTFLNNFMAPNPLKHYLGYYNDESVATLTAFVHGTNVGLYHAATLSKSENQGLCLALSQHAMQEARVSGCRYVVSQLQAPYFAKNLSEKLGFYPCCQISKFIFETEWSLKNFRLNKDLDVRKKFALFT